MSQQASDRIVQERSARPHIKGTRIDVLTLYEYVEGQGLHPTTVAERFDLDVADVYHALAYYYNHPEEMAELREQKDQAHEDFLDLVEDHRPPGVSPDSGTSE